MGWFRLAWRDTWGNRGRAWTSIVGISLGVAVLLVVTGLGMGIKEVVLRDIVRELPVDVVEMTPRTMDLGIIKTRSLFGAKDVPQKVVRGLRDLDFVEEVYPQLDVPIPMTAKDRSGFIDRRAAADLILVGVPGELIRTEVPGFDDDPETLQVVISDQLIDIYNDSVAPVIETPRITEALLKNFPFELRVGTSVMMGARSARRTGREEGRVVGTSRWAMRLGATTTIESARRMLSKYGKGYAPDHDVSQPFENESYRSVFVRATGADRIPELIATIESMGYAVDQSAQQTRRIMTGFVAFSSTLGFLILLLAALNIAHSFFAQLMEQRKELGVLRSVGATRPQLLALVLCKAALLGGAGSLLGVVGALAGAKTLDWAALTFLPSFPFQPESFFVFPAWLIALSVLAAIGAAIGGALVPGAQAAYRSITDNLVD